MRSATARSSNRLPSFHARLLASSWESEGFRKRRRRATWSGLKNAMPAWIRASPATLDLPAPLVPASTVIRAECFGLFSTTSAGASHGRFAECVRSHTEKATNGAASHGGLHALEQPVELPPERIEPGLRSLFEGLEF